MFRAEDVRLQLEFSLLTARMAELLPPFRFFLCSLMPGWIWFVLTRFLIGGGRRPSLISLRVVLGRSHTGCIKSVDTILRSGGRLDYSSNYAGTLKLEICLTSLYFSLALSGWIGSSSFRMVKPSED